MCEGSELVRSLLNVFGKNACASKKIDTVHHPELITPMVKLCDGSITLYLYLTATGEKRWSQLSGRSIEVFKPYSHARMAL